MDLTDDLKQQIDSLDYYALLWRWRFAPIGNPMFQGESGEYWHKRMTELRVADPAHAVAVSKQIGWQ